MNTQTKILVLGGTGLVGSSLVRLFNKEKFKNVISPNRKELDLFNGQDVIDFFTKHKPQVVINAAAKVGGINANNTYRADFILQNLNIQNNIFNASLKVNVPKFLFFGSSCIYPKYAEQPIKEESLLTGSLETTNEPYAVAKIAGLKVAENIKRQFGLNFFSVLPTNLYGVNDNFHPENSHVIPGIVHRMHKVIKSGKDTFEIWGSGTVKREFLYVDDLADACLFLLLQKDVPQFINIGTGQDITITELTHKIANRMGFKGKFVFNTSYPDGTPRKLLDVSKIHNMGWKHKISLDEGLDKTIRYFQGLNF